MLETVARHWWILLARGIIAMIFGVVAISVPGITALALALIFGAYALVDGIVAVVHALRMTKTGGRWVWLFTEGVLGALFGTAALAFPGITLLLLVYIVAGWAIVTGVTAISTAWRVRAAISGEWLWILVGVLSLLFGIAIVFEPAAGLFAVVYTLAFYAILTGFTFVGLALRLRTAAPTTPRAS